MDFLKSVDLINFFSVTGVMPACLLSALQKATRKYSKTRTGYRAELQQAATKQNGVKCYATNTQTYVAVNDFPGILVFVNLAT